MFLHWFFYIYFSHLSESSFHFTSEGSKKPYKYVNWNPCASRVLHSLEITYLIYPCRNQHTAHLGSPKGNIIVDNQSSKLVVGDGTSTTFHVEQSVIISWFVTRNQKVQKISYHNICAVWNRTENPTVIPKYNFIN